MSEALWKQSINFISFRLYNCSQSRINIFNNFSIKKLQNAESEEKFPSILGEKPIEFDYDILQVIEPVIKQRNIH